MRNLDARIAALEAADLNRRGGAALVLLAVPALTAEQHAQATAATREGRDVFVIEVVPAAAGGAPDKAGNLQA